MIGSFLKSIKSYDKNGSSSEIQKTLSPRMKVFTVGLDQKPPLKSDDASVSEKAEKAGSPPPGYSTAVSNEHNQRLALPLGPEVPLAPTPLIMRKSRGYKGIVMVMLSVFLIALFALMLSEIAYNRQRDENFLRLRWAELKHRLGGYGDYDYYFNRGPYAYNLNKQKELGELYPSVFPGQQPIVPQQQEQNRQQQTQNVIDETTTATPVLAEVIDTSKSNWRRPLFPSSSSGMSLSRGSSSASSSMELQSPSTHEIMPDARLQFLRSILRRIRQHAEDMGFDGMMQVSVIEVEPQGEENIGKPSIQQILPGLFSHLVGQQQPRQEPQSMNVKSDAFLDGFGEIHQPSFIQNNQIAEQNRARLDNSNNEIDIESPMRWSRMNNPFNTEGFFRPPNWQLITPQEQEQQQLSSPQQQSQQSHLRQPQAQFQAQMPHILPRPFEQWNGNGVGEEEIISRRFGQPQTQQQAQLQFLQGQPQPPAEQPMIHMFPQPASLFFPSPQSQKVQSSQQKFVQQPIPQFPIGQMMGVADGQMPLGGFRAGTPNIIPPMPMPPPSPAMFEIGQQPIEISQPLAARGPEPNQEMGEIRGGKIGQIIKEIIANRVAALNQLPSQNQMTFVPPENRIQIEPPTTTANPQQKSVDNNNDERKVPKSTIVDNDESNDKNNNIGWTHQPPIVGPVITPLDINDDGFESMRNFAKMMAAGVAEEAARRRAELFGASSTLNAPVSSSSEDIDFNKKRPQNIFVLPPARFIDSSASSVANERSSGDVMDDGNKPSSEIVQKTKPIHVPIMPILSIDPPIRTISPPGFLPTLKWRHADGRIFSSAAAVPVDEEVHPLIFDQSNKKVENHHNKLTLSNDISVRNQIATKEKIEKLPMSKTIKQSQLPINRPKNLNLIGNDTFKSTIQIEDGNDTRFVKLNPVNLTTDDSIKWRQNITSLPVILPTSLFDVTDKAVGQLVTPSFDIFTVNSIKTDNMDTNEDTIDQSTNTIPDAKPLPLPFVLNEDENESSIEDHTVTIKPTNKFTYQQKNFNKIVVDSDLIPFATIKPSGRLNIVPFRQVISSFESKHHTQFANAEKIVGTNDRNVVIGESENDAEFNIINEKLIHSSSPGLSAMLKSKYKIGEEKQNETASFVTIVNDEKHEDNVQRTFTNETLTLLDLSNDLVNDSIVDDPFNVQELEEKSIDYDKPITIIKDYFVPKIASKFTPDNIITSNKKNETMEKPIINQLLQHTSGTEGDSKNINDFKDLKYIKEGDANNKLTERLNITDGLISQNDYKNIDFPTVRFPANNNHNNNKEKDIVESKRAKLTVDHTMSNSQNDDISPSVDAIKSVSAETETSSSDEKGVPQQLPQMHEAPEALSNAHSNGVFFQVDDPSAVETRPIITA